MAVAVKNSRETQTTPLLDRLQVNIFCGVAYVLGSLGIIFPLLDIVWWHWLRLDITSPWLWAGRIVFGLGAAVFLGWLGLKLLGPEPKRGLCAGIAVGVVGVFLIALITQALGMWVEDWAYNNAGWGDWSWRIGVGVTLLVGVALLIGFGYLFFIRQMEQSLGTLEDQNLFVPKGYKPNQGQKVRRGTVLGLLVIFGAGIWSLLPALEAAGDWKLPLPFTGKVLITPENAGDNPVFTAKLAEAGGAVEADRFQVRAANAEFAGKYVKIVDPGKDQDVPGFPARSVEKGKLLTKEEFQQLVQERKKKQVDFPGFGADAFVPPMAEEKLAPIDAVKVSADKTESYLRYTTLTVLPQMKFTAPLLLAALGLWFAWRVVNMPMFGDFLIATEAELNKVSWTTPKRLLQDTVVVLVTVVLMTVLLFFADAGWGWLLQTIKVLQTSGQQAKQQQQDW